MMKTRDRLLTAVIHCAAVIGPALSLAAAGAEPGPEAMEPLKVCADPYMLPFSNEQGAGFENKIAELFAARLGKPLQYEWFPQRQGFIRNTLRAEGDDGKFKCDLVMTVPDGFEIAATTRPYFASRYFLVIAKGRGLDDITAPEMLERAAAEGRPVKVALSDQGPGQLWVFRHGLMGNMVPYIGQPGDPTVNPGEVIMRDIASGKADASVIWGPTAGYYAKVLAGQAQFMLLPLKNDPRYPDMPLEYNMSMAVRHGEKEWLATVNRLLQDNAAEIGRIMQEFNVPLIPIGERVKHDDD
ncbi:MAG: quinoprotein dehydrogenase-associated putative ABC transporter substrate-binding protein [Gammaproteobacteria bacterium]|nr:quinoprotein dehydrogenase-associated putative ABC transporter substrate-binding protein [Gammaproteobacteria bacterium]